MRIDLHTSMHAWMHKCFLARLHMRGHIHTYVRTFEEHTGSYIHYTYVDGLHIHRYRNTAIHALPPAQILEYMCDIYIDACIDT